MAVRGFICEKNSFDSVPFVFFVLFVFFYYRKGKNTVQVRKKLGKVCGKSVLTVLKLLDIKDAPRSERPVEIDEDEITIQSDNFYEIECVQFDRSWCAIKKVCFIVERKKTELLSDQLEYNERNNRSKLK